jgi:hypothetical protein
MMWQEGGSIYVVSWLIRFFLDKSKAIEYAGAGNV